MKKIKYQGQKISAQLIGRIDGGDKITDGLHKSWADELWRDSDGQYYATRERHIRDERGKVAKNRKRTYTIRRISPRAAILWAICLTGCDGLALRKDAVAILNASRTAEKPGMHTLTLELSENQFRMLQQAAKYDGDEPEDWIMDQLRSDVVCILSDCYEHREARAFVGWDGCGEKPPKRGPNPRFFKPEAEMRLTEGERAILERRARVEGTDLRTQFEFMTEHGTNAVLGFDKSVGAELDPFHGDLLRAFERRNQIDADTYTRAVVEWHLEEMFDVGWNGGETERNMAVGIREYGQYAASMTTEFLEKLCRAAGLNPADYPDAVDEDEDDEPTMPTAGRRHAGNPADVALLAAADPSLDDDEDNQNEEPPTPKATDASNGEEGN